MPEKNKRPAGLYKHKNSPLWQYDFRLKGVRFSGSTGTANAREAAKFLRLKREEARKALDQRTITADLTMNEAAERYFQERGQYLSDANDLDRNLSRIVEFFGRDTKLAHAVTGECGKQLATLVARRRGETIFGKGEKLVSNRTVNLDVIDCFSRLVNYARKAWKLKASIEAPDFNDLRLPETAERVRDLSFDQHKALTAALRPDYHPVLAFSLATGMRKMNAVSLSWAQIDEQRRIARIKVKDRDNKERWHEVFLTDVAMAILVGERGNHETRVFTYVCQRGADKGKRKPITVSGLRRAWDTAREQAGLDDFRWHDLRHDFATNLLRRSSKSNLKLVQKALGHKTLAATARYAHVDVSDVAAAMREAESKDSRKSPGIVVSNTKNSNKNR
ncbi:MAG: site-specific integrase [Pseudomonadota bacterium]